MTQRRNFIKTLSGFVFFSSVLPARLFAEKKDPKKTRLELFLTFSKSLTGSNSLDETLASRILVSLDLDFSEILVSQTLALFEKNEVKNEAKSAGKMALSSLYAKASSKAFCQKALRYWYADFKQMGAWSETDRAFAYRSSCLWAPLHTTPVGVPVGSAVWAEKPRSFL